MAAARKINVLMTRPEGAMDAFLADFKTLAGARFENYRFISLPLLAIEYLAPERMPEAARYDALVFSSANGVEGFIRAAHNWEAFKNLPVFAVGPQTRAALLAHGFEDVRDGGGAAESLIGGLKSFAGQQAIRPKILYVRGVHLMKELGGLLEEVAEWAEYIVYDSKLRTSFLDKEIEELRVHCIDYAMFFSKRTAAHFVDLARKNENFLDFSTTKLLCISSSVLECVRPDFGGNAYSAERPDRRGMQELLLSFDD